MISEEEKQEFINNLNKFSNTKLCEIVITNRYIGVMRDEAVLSMEELVKRRNNGDNFDYETYIQQEFEKLPKLDLDLNKILSIKNWF